MQLQWAWVTASLLALGQVSLLGWKCRSVWAMACRLAKSYPWAWPGASRLASATLTAFLLPSGPVSELVSLYHSALARAYQSNLLSE